MKRKHPDEDDGYIGQAEDPAFSLDAETISKLLDGAAEV
jgi:hypothetical protein